MATQIIVSSLLNEATTNATSSAYLIGGGSRTIEAYITGSGTVSATVSWYGCNFNRNANGVLFAVTTLSGTTTDASGTFVTETWPYVYCVVSAISGTNAKVTASVGN